MERRILNRGAVLVDKPKGMTSFDVVEKVGQAFAISKAGHTGTLDPNVTGLMLIALGESRKAMPVLMGMDKEYEGIMVLHGEASRKELEASFRKFTGEIVQKPPVRSRVARNERKRNIHLLKILGVDGRNVLFRVSCEAGTYIRKLVHDIGQDLGTGAHMAELRRTKIGPFRIKEAVSLDSILQDEVIRIEDVLDRIKLKKLTVKDEVVPKIRNGSPVFKEWIKKKDKINEDEIAGIYDESGEIIALCRPVRDKIKVERVFL